MVDQPESRDEGVILHRVPDAEIQLKREAQNMGRVGSWFGSKENAALYFAASLMLLSMLFLGILALVEPPMRAEIAKVFAAVIVGALGFIGGLLGSRNN